MQNSVNHSGQVFTRETEKEEEKEEERKREREGVKEQGFLV